MIILRLLLTRAAAEAFRHKEPGLCLPDEMTPWLQGRVLFVPGYPETVAAVGKMLPFRYRGRLCEERYEVLHAGRP